MFRAYFGAALIALAPLGLAHGQVNLLTNGSFEENNGFTCNGNDGDPECMPFETAFNFAGFQGWPGWASDFDDDGLRNDSYDTGTPGGFMFFNLFPAGGDNASQPVLTGEDSVLALGPFDGNTTSFAWQQVAVTPGDTVRATVWARVDSGASDPTLFDSDSNQAFHSVDFIDPLTGDPDIFLPSPDEETIFDAATQNLVDVDQMWFESSFDVVVPAGASLFRQTIGYNQFDFGAGVSFFDTASIVNLSTGTPLNGDYDYDGTLTEDDANMLSLLLAGELVPVDESRFDFDGNESIEQADLDALLALIGPELMADFNGDGNVDLLDLDILGQNFGGPGGPMTGDANGDGFVDLLDLDVLGQEFGSGGSTAVPEPTAAALLAMAAASAMWRRR